MQLVVNTSLHRTAAAVAIAALLCVLPAHAAQLSRSTHSALSEARELMDADKHEAALAKLNELVGKVDKREYEKALTLQTLGYALVGMDRDTDAIDAFERALALDALPDAPRIKLKNMLARLYARTEQYARAKDYLDAWFSEIDKPDAGDYALKANILAQLDRNAEGIEAIQQAIELSDRPREQYYQLLVSLQYRSERYTQAAATLEQMLTRWPQKKQYWTQLSSVFLNLERNEDAHAVLRLAYRKGLLEQESELVRLARVALSIDVPAGAAELVEEEIGTGRIEASEDHWELAARAWARAKEWDKASAAYANAAEYGNPGKYHMRRARMFTYENEWQRVIDAARKALEDGELDSPGQAHILIGRGHLEFDRHDEAMAAFEAAQRFNDTADQAQHWSKYAKRQKEYTGGTSNS